MLINPESLLVLVCGVQFLQLPGMFVGQRVLAVAWTIRALLQLFAIGPAWPLGVRWLHRSLATTYSALAVGYSLICWLLLVPTSL